MWFWKHRENWMEWLNSLVIAKMFMYVFSPTFSSQGCSLNHKDDLYCSNCPYIHTIVETWYLQSDLIKACSLYWHAVLKILCFSKTWIVHCHLNSNFNRGFPHTDFSWEGLFNIGECLGGMELFTRALNPRYQMEKIYNECYFTFQWLVPMLQRGWLLFLF